ncbi:uncharacterized protein ACIBXB_006058 isoform 2-T3 [Morphnus guianensis]
MSHLPHPCSAGLACTHVHLWKSFYVALCGFHVCGLSSGLGWSCGCSPQQVWFSDGEVTRMVGWCRVRPWLPPTLSWCCTVPQEAARLCQPPACSPLCRKAIEGLVALSEDGCSPISIQQMAYVAGVGFGLMSGTFSMINLLADALGPGTTGIHGDSQLYFLTSDVLQPPVHGQPGALLPADGHRRHLGLPALRGLRPEPAALPALSVEWSQPSAGILRPHGMFLSPAAPALPSILVARAAITFSAISFLLDWWTLASSGRTGAGVWLQQPADRCGWSWLALPPLWEPPENSSVLGNLALLALLRVEPQLACLGRMLPWTAGGLSPKKPITSPSAAEDVLSPVPGQGETRASSLPQGEGSGFAKCCQALGWG